MKNITKEVSYGGKTLEFNIGEYAPRANASILASMGETTVLVTVTVSDEDADTDYFPLTVEYIEKLYAGGIISGSRYVKRERHPSVEATLNARIIDRSLRSLFSAEIRRSVQVVVTVMSFDKENDPVILGLNAVATAIHLCEIPFSGPVAAVRLGYRDGEFLVNPGINPSNSKVEDSELNLIISGTRDAIVQLDGGASEIADDVMAEAFDFAHEQLTPMFDFQEDLQKELEVEKIELELKDIDEELKKYVLDNFDEKLTEAVYSEDRDSTIKEVVAKIKEEKSEDYSKKEISNIVYKIVKEKVRSGILNDQKRPSGRALDEIRKIIVKPSVLPKTHGSALFSRGLTQALSIATLGSTRLEKTMEGLAGEQTKRYMHHYNAPTFSFGEAGRYSYYPKRREVGHGSLAEKALEPVLPSEEEFPYAVRVVSEVLSQRGSSSMAATCGSTLSLMDAGVPIKRPVAGIAIGLVTAEDSDDYVLITDVQDVEDFYGDMDFKVTGTDKGITAIQMDNKLHGIPVKILKEALVKARKGCEHVLGKMSEVISEPNKNLSEHAPKISSLKINPQKIGELIGPGGKVIRSIIEDTGAEINVDDDGVVNVSATSEKARKDAIKRIESIVEEPEVGKVYEGTVATVKDYGAFVDVSKSISGLVHKSEMSDEFVSNPSKMLSEGDKVKVKLIGIDDQERVNFSMKQVKKDK